MTSTQMGEIIGGVKMTTLPLNGRAYTDLLALRPGVVAVNAGTYSSQAVSGNLNSGNLSVGGQRESANGFVVNGGSVQESTSMGTSIIPDLDSIAEFRNRVKVRDEDRKSTRLNSSHITNSYA